MGGSQWHVCRRHDQEERECSVTSDAHEHRAYLHHTRSSDAGETRCCARVTEQLFQDTDRPSRRARLRGERASANTEPVTRRTRGRGPLPARAPVHTTTITMDGSKPKRDFRECRYARASLFPVLVFSLVVVHAAHAHGHLCDVYIHACVCVVQCRVHTHTHTPIAICRPKGP